MNAAFEFLRFENAAVRAGELVRFHRMNWTWKLGEQWAILGGDDSGKALLVRALLGQAPLASGEIRGPRDPADDSELDPSDSVAVVSPETQRQAALAASSFYQSRWHSGLEHGDRTVAAFLSQASVERRNPYEISATHGNARDFQRARRRYLDWLGARPLWRRQLAHLSNGEFRKVLLIEALLRKPRLLVLEEATAGLDVATRATLRRVVARLMEEGWRILTVTNRAEEIPDPTTHALIVDKFQIAAQGSKCAMVKLWQERFLDSHSVPQTTAPRGGRSRGRLGREQSGRALVELRGVTVAGLRKPILRAVSWTLRAGECWALLGPNGAGKTTLLNLIQGDHPQAYSQDIRLFGRGTESTQALWEARQRMGWLSPELHYHYPADWESIDVAASGHFNSLGLYQACSQRQRAAALSWLRALGLSGSARTAFGDLTFGQQRLVLLARAAVKNPDLLILDEPCQGLDAHQRSRLFEAVDAIVNRTGCGLLFVTHHQHEVPRCITHVLRIKTGRVFKAAPKPVL